MNEFAVIAVASIFTSNVVAVSGAGAASLQSEKKNFIFMLVSTLCTIVSSIISGLLFWVINRFVLARVGLEVLKLFVVVLLAVIMAFISRALLKAVTRETFYLYEASYSFPIQTAVNVGLLILVDYSRTFMKTMFEIAMFCVGYLLVQVIFYALHERLDNSYTLKPARNVPLTLFMLSIIGMILFVFEGMI